MRITLKGIIDEDLVNYKVPSMTLMFPKCDFKCGDFCQNKPLAEDMEVTGSVRMLCERYLRNGISKAIVCQGLEPMDTFTQLLSFISMLRTGYGCEDDVVIYTGYTKEELEDKGYLKKLREFKNIIIKYGRYIPNETAHYDPVLEVLLASDNQYAEVLS